MSEDIINKNVEAPPKRKSAKKGKLFCYISILFIIGILAGGILWQYSAELNSDYKRVNLNVVLIHSNEGYDPILYNKLNLDEGVTIKPLKEQDINATNLNGIDLVIVSNVDLSNTARTYLAQYMTASNDNSVMFLLDVNTDGADLEYLNILVSPKHLRDNHDHKQDKLWAFL